MDICCTLPGVTINGVCLTGVASWLTLAATHSAEAAHAVVMPKQTQPSKRQRILQHAGSDTSLLQHSSVPASDLAPEIETEACL